ncbi:MAG: hypothetical protein HUK04_00580 [Bacteroidaceae bacterium]|nr:hypothetical protein [Bacteroidaceae bacterium]
MEIRRDKYLSQLEGMMHTNFVKIVTGRDEAGITTINIYDFLLNPNSLEL